MKNAQETHQSIERDLLKELAKLEKFVAQLGSGKSNREYVGSYETRKGVVLPAPLYQNRHLLEPRSMQAQRVQGQGQGQGQGNVQENFSRWGKPRPRSLFDLNNGTGETDDLAESDDDTHRLDSRSGAGESAAQDWSSSSDEHPMDTSQTSSGWQSNSSCGPNDSLDVETDLDFGLQEAPPSPASTMQVYRKASPAPRAVKSTAPSIDTATLMLHTTTKRGAAGNLGRKRPVAISASSRDVAHHAPSAPQTSASQTSKREAPTTLPAFKKKFPASQDLGSWEDSPAGKSLFGRYDALSAPAPLSLALRHTENALNERSGGARPHVQFREPLKSGRGGGRGCGGRGGGW